MIHALNTCQDGNENMPRINTLKTECTGNALKAAAMRRGYSLQRLAKVTGIKPRTLYRRIAEPYTMTVDELRRMNAVLHFEDGELIEFVRGFYV